MDEFTKKRAVKEVVDKCFNEKDVVLDVTQEFGRRVRYATDNGVPRDSAIELCRSHYKKVGQAMLDVADLCAETLQNTSKSEGE